MSRASSSLAFCSGVFATERGQRLLWVVRQLARRAFGEIHAKHGGHDERYRKCLAHAMQWPDAVVQAEVAALRQCDDFERRVRDVFVAYVDDLHAARAEALRVRPPSALDFARTFLRAAAGHPSMRDASFFGDGLVEQMLCADCAREALFALSQNERHVRGDEPTVVPPDAKSLASLAAETASVLDASITPDDSISNIGRFRAADAPTAPPPPTAPNAPSAAGVRPGPKPAPALAPSTKPGATPSAKPSTKPSDESDASLASRPATRLARRDDERSVSVALTDRQDDDAASAVSDTMRSEVMASDLLRLKMPPSEA